MEITSSRFGDVTINKKSIIKFPEGLPGFKNLLEFAIIRCDQTEPIQWLQSVDDADISLPIINPFIIEPEYEIEVNDDELDVIQTHSEKDMIVLNIMVLPEDLSKMTVNLMAPILINVQEMLGTQVMMDYKPLPIRHPAFEPLMGYYREIEKGVSAVASSDTEDK